MKTRTAELRKVRDYLKNVEQEVNRFRVIPRAANKFPFDIVGLASLSKAFAIAKACMKLLASNQPDEAYGLSRSLVECAANLRYLTAIPSERDKHTRDFVNFALADKALWYHYALRSAKTSTEKAELQAYAKQMGVSDNPKLARQHWSGETASFVWTTTVLDHPLDRARTLDHRKKAHAVDYYLTSAFVHCSLLATDNYFTEDESLYRVASSSAHRETFQSTLFIILIHIHDAIGYVLYGLNTDRPARLNSLYEKTLRTMKPIPTRHKRVLNRKPLSLK